MLNPGYLLSPRTKKSLITLATTNGVFPFRGEMLAGKLNGHPYRSTSQIPENIGGTDSYILFADFGQVVVVDGLAMQVDTSAEAMFIDGNGNATSAFQNDQTLTRVITETDLVVRHAEGVASATAVKWA